MFFVKSVAICLFFIPMQQNMATASNRISVVAVVLQQKDCHSIPTIKARVIGSNGGMAMV
jgi:hypothetical protein